MKPTIYGYVRVSTKEQCEDRQLIALQEFSVPRENVYIDKLSGKDFNRPRYKRLMRKIRPGDTLVLKSIDRLGRNYEEILKQWRSGHCRSGHAAFGHPADRPKSDGYFCGRSGAADSVLCGPDRAGEYTPEAEGRDCGCQAAGRAVWKAEKRNPGNVLEAENRMGKPGDHFKKSGGTARNCTGHLSPLGA